MRKFIFSLFFVFLLSTAILDAQAQEIVTTSGEVIVGKSINDTRVFLGIPYAAPPVGDLRWSSPQPKEHMDSILALDWSAKCPQKVFKQGGNPGEFTIEGREDCLYLNIWSPTNSTKPLPVMVFIHGGGNQQGSASEQSGGAYLYDGIHLSERGHVILVTIQYRLGALGYLVHPALETLSPEGVSGNYGLLDQILALKWIKENIGAFGGDANNVTIFGESAGAVNIGTLMLSPRAKGLFHKAIMESGTPFIKPYEKAKLAGMAFADSLQCSSGSLEQQLNCLRALSPEELISLENSPIANLGKGGFIGPVADSWFLPVDPVYPYSKGIQSKIPVIIGSNSNEMGIAIPQSVQPKEVENFFKAIAPASMVEEGLRLYPPGKNPFSARKAMVDATTDAFFTAPARRSARAISALQSQPVRRYVFDHKLTGLGGVLGAFHGLELFYVFNSVEDSDYGKPKLNKEDRYMADLLLYQWTSFASQGIPEYAPAEVWPQYQPQEDNSYKLSAPASTLSMYRSVKCDYWDRLYDSLATGTIHPTPDVLASFSITPNPAKNTALLHFGSSINSGRSFALLHILDSGGNIALFKVLSLRKGQREYPLDISSLPAGMYHVVVRMKNKRLHSSLIVRD